MTDDYEEEGEVQEQEWMAMKDAAKTLKISYWKLQRLVDRGVIRTQTDELDRRVRLVELGEVRRIFRLK